MAGIVAARSGRLLGRGWSRHGQTVAAFLALLVLGVVLSCAASPAVAERIGLEPYHFVTRQVLFMLPALAIMIGVSFLDPRNIRRLSVIMLVGSLLMMVAALYIVGEVKGSRRWIYIAGMSV
jgi:cell division protein FtsW